MSIRHRRDIWKLLLDAPKGNAAEIGVAEGFFSADILAWPIQFPKVYMVDRWSYADVKGDSSSPQKWHDENYEAAVKRVARFGERAVILRGESTAMALRVPDRSLAFVNVDADHSYEGAITDARTWCPKLVDGGVMAFHDYLNPNYGVKAAVNDFCNEHGFQAVLLPEDHFADAGAYFICRR